MRRKEEKELGFKMPENYFENFEASIQNKITTRNAKKVVSLYDKRILFAASSIAAALILAITLINTSVFNVVPKNNNTIVDVQNFVDDEKTEGNDLSLLDYYISDTDQNDLAEYYLIESALTDVIENP